MTKRVVVRVPARGYVDGRYIGEEKEVIEAIDPSGRGKRRSGKAAGKTSGAADDRGNRIGGKGAKAAGRGKRGARAEPGLPRNARAARGATRSPTVRAVGGVADGNTLGAGPAAARGRGGRGKSRAHNAGEARTFAAGGNALPVGADGRAGLPRARKNRGGKKTPFRTAINAGNSSNIQAGSRALISEVADTRRWGDESKSGQFAEALAKEATIKRERLHKVLAQSGHGSRRDMEIMISSGRVMVNGIVATTGTSVSPADAVMIDKRMVKLKFSEELPRVLLYHKPEGEIVTTSDPGNRITVFDNLPPVENGKWMSVGRLDINTSGLLIFTTSGELANRLMHPRYEVEREYAVRVLGELNEEQTQRLLTGVSIVVEPDEMTEDEVETVEDRPAKFESIDKRGGEGVNQWYHVVLKEGRNREVRKMFEAVGLTVSRLMRVRFGKIGLPPRLTRGRMIEFDEPQVRAVLRWVGMEVEGQIGQLPTLEPTRPVHVSRREREQNAAGLAHGSGGGANALVGEGEVGDAPRGINAPPDKARRGRGRRARGKRGVVDTPLAVGDMIERTPGELPVAAAFSPEALPGAAVAADGTKLGRDSRRGRGRNSRRAGRERLPGTDGVVESQVFTDRPRAAAQTLDADSIGNAIPSAVPGAVYDDVDDSIGNRIIPAQVETVHRSTAPRGSPQGRSEPRRRSRRRRNGPKGAGGQGNTL